MAAYIAAWLPVTAGMIYLVSGMVSCSFVDVAMLVMPAMILQMVMFGGVWYVSRATPFTAGRLAAFFIRHIISFAVLTAIWLYILMILAEALNTFLENNSLRMCFDTALPLFITIGFFIYFVAALISYLTLANEKTRRAEVALLENTVKVKETELKFLKASVHPHFMFNSLNALATLIRTQPGKAQTVCLKLAGFLRYSLSFKNDIVPLSSEIEHIKNYLSIERIRLENRLDVHWQLGDGLENEPILGFCLQPLVENAVKHGIEPLRQGGTVSLDIKCTDTQVIIEISNPLPEVRSDRPSTGQGLLILKGRLEQAYHNGARMVVHKGEKAFAIKLYLPRIRQRDEDV